LNKSWYSHYQRVRLRFIYSTSDAFAVLKADGSIMAWGASGYGGTGAPSDNGYTKIYSNWFSFAALKTDGSIKVIDPSALRAAKAYLVE
jgi:hypothetical protein